MACDYGIALEALFIKAEVGGPVGDEGADLGEGARVEQEVQPLAGRELPPLVLCFDAPVAPALLRGGASGSEGGSSVRGGGVGGRGIGSYGASAPVIGGVGSRGRLCRRGNPSLPPRCGQVDLRRAAVGPGATIASGQSPNEGLWEEA